MQKESVVEPAAQVSEQDSILKDYYILDEFIVKLKPGVEIDSLLAAFTQYEFTLKKTIVASMNMHLFSYNMEKIGAVEIFRLLEQSEHIEKLEFNKNLNKRRSPEQK